MNKTIKELWKFRSNIFKPNIHSRINNYYGDRTSRTVRFGTYLKPIARIVGKLANLAGYKIRYWTRGQRKGKSQNWQHGIRTQDSIFLSVYGEKTIVQ